MFTLMSGNALSCLEQYYRLNRKPPPRFGQNIVWLSLFCRGTAFFALRAQRQLAPRRTTEAICCTVCTILGSFLYIHMIQTSVWWGFLSYVILYVVLELRILEFGYTVQYRYKVAKYLKIMTSSIPMPNGIHWSNVTHSRRAMPRPYGRAMRCLFWVT